MLYNLSDCINIIVYKIRKSEWIWDYLHIIIIFNNNNNYKQKNKQAVTAVFQPALYGQWFVENWSSVVAHVLNRMLLI